MKNFVLREEVRNDMYNDWKNLFRGHKSFKVNYREVGFELNYEFDVSLPVTKQHGIHEINGYLYRLRIYPIETKQGNVNFIGYINEEGTKLYVYTKKYFQAWEIYNSQTLCISFLQF